MGTLVQGAGADRIRRCPRPRASREDRHDHARHRSTLPASATASSPARAASATGIFASLNCSFGSGDDAAQGRREPRAARWPRSASRPTALVTGYQVHGADVVAGRAAVAARGSAARRRAGDAAAGHRARHPHRRLRAGAVRRSRGRDRRRGACRLARRARRRARGDGRGDGARGRRAARASAPAIGPCIGARSYEVGPEFPAPFLAEDPANARFFAAGAARGPFPASISAGYVDGELAALGVGTRRAHRRRHRGGGRALLLLSPRLPQRREAVRPSLLDLPSRLVRAASCASCRYALHSPRRLALRCSSAAACQPLPHPFADSERAARPRRRCARPTAPAIVVLPVDGRARAGGGRRRPRPWPRRCATPTCRPAPMRRQSRQLPPRRAPPRRRRPARTRVTIAWTLARRRRHSSSATARHGARRQRAWQQGDAPCAPALAGAAAPAIARWSTATRRCRTVQRRRSRCRQRDGAPGDGGTALARAIGAALGPRRRRCRRSAGGKARFTLSVPGRGRAARGRQAAASRCAGSLARPDGHEIGEVARRTPCRPAASTAPGAISPMPSPAAAAPGIAELIAARRQLADRRRLNAGPEAGLQPGTVCYSPRPAEAAAAPFPGDSAHENPRLQQQSAAGRGDFGLSQPAADRCQRAPLLRHGSVRRDPRERARRGRVRHPVDLLSRPTTI